MKKERQALWTLAWPVMMTTGASMSLGMVDMIMVGHFGATAIASLSVSVTWMYAVGVFGRNISGGVEPLVSQAAGDKQTEIRGELFQHLLQLVWVWCYCLFAMIHTSMASFRMVMVLFLT